MALYRVQSCGGSDDDLLLLHWYCLPGIKIYGSDTPDTRGESHSCHCQPIRGLCLDSLDQSEAWDSPSSISDKEIYVKTSPSPDGECDVYGNYGNAEMSPGVIYGVLWWADPSTAWVNISLTPGHSHVL